MAVVREELRLVDYFSGTIRSYTQGVRTARQGTAALQTAAQQLTAAAGADELQPGQCRWAGFVIAEISRNLS